LARTEELGAEPLKVRALRHDFVLFRDSNGEAHCLADICIHRNGSLAAGSVHGNCIQCPYHGWRIDTDALDRLGAGQAGAGFL